MLFAAEKGVLGSFSLSVYIVKCYLCLPNVFLSFTVFISRLPTWEKLSVVEIEVIMMSSRCIRCEISSSESSGGVLKLITV